MMELRPCPFCGGEVHGPLTKRWKNVLGDVSYSAFIRCDGCNECRTMFETDSAAYKTEEEAADAVASAWNKRHADRYGSGFFNELVDAVNEACREEEQ